jgi:hypothetical protein
MISITILTMGSLLIVTGMGLVIYQVLKPPPSNIEPSPMAGGGFKASSPYPGIVMIGFGTALLGIAAVRG